jgi:hypothetical protein
MSGILVAFFAIWILAVVSNTASMKDITENEEASGSYWKNADGTLEAKWSDLNR